METLSGKTAIVTGGTRGIGRAITERLLDAGVAVAICGRRRESVDLATRELAGRGKVFGVAADIRRVEDVRSFFAAVDREFGGLDILVNNAGQGVFKKVGEMTPEEWHRNIDLNLNGAFYCCARGARALRRRGGGFIVNISSLAGKNAFSGGAGYNASKVRTQWFHRSADAGPPLRQRARQLRSCRAASIRNFPEIRASRRGRHQSG